MYLPNRGDIVLLLLFLPLLKLPLIDQHLLEYCFYSLYFFSLEISQFFDQSLSIDGKNLVEDDPSALSLKINAHTTRIGAGSSGHRSNNDCRDGVVHLIRRYDSAGTCFPDFMTFSRIEGDENYIVLPYAHLNPIPTRMFPNLLVPRVHLIL